VTQTIAVPRLRRSVLYRLGIGAEAAYETAPRFRPDVLLFEIEDSVPPGDKRRARERVVATLAQGGFRGQEKLVTINGLDTPWGHDDLAALAGAGADGLVLAKSETPEAVREAESILAARGAPPGLRLWPMIETPRGLVAAHALATASPLVAGLVVGLGDLSRGLNAFRRPAPQRWPVLAALAGIVLAARAAGIAVLDSAFREPADAAGFRAACVESRELGFDGKVFEDARLIAVANEAYAPGAEEIAWAERVLAARATAPANGEYYVDGRHIDPQYEALAERILAFRRAVTAWDEAA
jgi:citrate lyase subunit beta/citryl-CoA lyase